MAAAAIAEATTARRQGSAQAAPTASAVPPNVRPVTSSTRGYRGEMGARQCRHRPRRTSHEMRGTFSTVPNSVPQPGQWEGGRTTDMPRGTR